MLADDGEISAVAVPYPAQVGGQPPKFFRIIVTGPTELRGGRMLDTRDLRSGMSLIAAGLAAHGQTRVAPLETVERGYSHLVDRLKALGAKIAKVE